MPQERYATEAERQFREISESADFKHFLRLARRGKFPAASGGEYRAYRLAKAVLDDLPGLDDAAIAGLVRFIGCVYSAPMATADLLEGESR